MGQLFSNNGKTILASPVDTIATSIVVVDANVFPVITGSDTFKVTLESSNRLVVEIVEVTAVVGNTLTVVRAQEGTVATAFDAGSFVEGRLTAGWLNDIGTKLGTVSATELGYLDGVTSAIQTQLNGKAATTHTHAISDVTGLQTALDTKLASASYTASDVLAKIKTVDGAGSGLDADLLDGQQGSWYAPKDSPEFTGTPTTTTPTTGDSSTRIASTAYVNAEIANDAVTKTSSTGAAALPAGTVAQRPTGINGLIRYNSDFNQFEGFKSGSWGSLGAGDYKDGMVVVNDISKLSTVNTSVSTNVAVKSYHNGLEGGGGVFYYDSTKPRTEHNGGTVIAPNAVFPSDWNNQTQLAAWFDGSSLTGNGCWVRSYDGAVNVKWFGAKGDGASDDSLVLSEVKDLNITLTNGVYLSNIDLIFSNNVAFDGGILKHTGTNTTTFNKPIVANIVTIFELSTTSFVKLVNTEGYLEWFGAEHSNGVFDNAPIFEKAQFCIKKIKLLPKDYWISTTIDLFVDGFEIEGSGIHWSPSNTNATRIINTSATGDSIKLKPVTYTFNDPNSFLKEVKLSNFDIIRTKLTPPALGNEINGGSGIRLEYTLYTHIININVENHYIGFIASGTVRTNLTKCFAFRSPAIVPTTSVNDKFFGYWLHGNVDIGLAGGNASTYMDTCTASIGGSPVLEEETGLFLQGRYVDNFIHKFESSFVDVGILVDAGSEAVSTGQVDLHIRDAIIDVFKTAGIRVMNTYASGTMSISDAYFAPIGGSGGTMLGCVVFQNSYADATINNCQMICKPNTTALGIYISNSSGVTTKDNLISEATRPYLVSNSSYIIMEDSISNTTRTATIPAVYVKNTTKSYFKPRIKGAAGMFSDCLTLEDDSCQFNEVNLTSVDVSTSTSGFKALLRDAGSFTRQTSINQVLNNNLISGMYP